MVWKQLSKEARGRRIWARAATIVMPENDSDVHGKGTGTDDGGVQGGLWGEALTVHVRFTSLPNKQGRRKVSGWVSEGQI